MRVAKTGSACERGVSNVSPRQGSRATAPLSHSRRAQSDTSARAGIHNCHGDILPAARMLGASKSPPSAMKTRFVILSKAHGPASLRQRFPAIANEVHEACFDNSRRDGASVISFYDDAGRDGESPDAALERFLANWTPALQRLEPAFVETLEFEWIAFLDADRECEAISLNPDHLAVLATLQVRLMVAVLPGGETSLRSKVAKFPQPLRRLAAVG